MLGNTLTIDRDGTDVVVVRVNQDNYTSEYRKVETTGLWTLKIRHTWTGGKNGSPRYVRHNVELVHTIFATETTAEYYQKAYFVHEHLERDTEIDVIDALCQTAIATSSALLTSLVGLES